jgi:hypothetical protein
MGRRGGPNPHVRKRDTSGVTPHCQRRSFAVSALGYSASAKQFSDEGTGNFRRDRLGKPRLLESASRRAAHKSKGLRGVASDRILSEELLTCVPEPLCATSNASATSASYALRIVFRENPSVRARARVEGRRAPAHSFCSRIACRS